MLQVLLSWTVIAIVFLAFGSILSSVWNKCTKRADRFSLFDTFWLGVATVAILVTIVSLFLPIGIGVLVAFLVATVLSIFVCRDSIVRRSKRTFDSVQQISWRTKMVWILSILCILILSTGISLLYDSGLYHIPTMMWVEQYSVVPGLGNVHGRLSFNSTFLLLSTLFNYHPTIYTAFYSLSSLFLVVFVTWLIVGMSRRESIINNVISGLILVLSIFFFSPHLSSTSTDIPGSILVMYLLLSLAFDSGSVRNRALVLFLLPALCLTFKLSTAPICLLSLYVLYELIRTKEYKVLTILVVFALMLALPWLTRFVIVSGYLIYPFPSIDIFSFDWKIPLEKVQLEKDLAYSWARNSSLPYADVLAMSITEWMPIWFAALSLFNKILYIVALAMPAVVLGNYRLLKGKKEIVVAWCIAAIGLLFATVTAPDPRFSFGFMVCVIFIPVALIAYSRLGQKLEHLDTLFYRIFNMYPLGLVIILLWLNRMAVSQVHHYHVREQAMISLLIEPQQYNTTGRSEYVQRELSDGQYIYSPSTGDQCFDWCLPCTPYYNPQLQMRGSNLQNGFRVVK